MKIKFERNKKYSREGDYILEDGVKIIKLLQHFPVDIAEMDVNSKLYHEFYVSKNPELIEWLVKHKKYVVEETIIEPKKRGRKPKIK